jgi:Recombinase zinc beta ribbon domain
MPPPRHHASRPALVRVEGIATTLMSRPQRDRAVAALAVLTATGCHPAIIDDTAFAEAQRILAARGEDHAKRAASGSDYLLTGLTRCPSCGKAMIGIRAHGRSRVYRYYTCFTRVRYDTGRCHASRLDAAEHAVITALADFYRHGTTSSPTPSPLPKPRMQPTRMPAAGNWRRLSTSWPEPARRSTGT